MAKTNITLYSSTPSSNTDINNINIDENCPASGLNNAIRELMAHLKNVDTGSQALTALSVTGGLTVGGLTTLNGKFLIDGSANDLMTFRTTGDTSSQVLGLQFQNNSEAVTAQIFGTGDNSSNGVFRIKGIGNVDIIGGDVGVTGASADLRVHSSGVVSIPNGVELGSGVDATSANILDDYEEGTWTPAVNSGGVTFGTINRAIYVKVGKSVFVQAFVNISSSGNATPFIISGLPFTTTLSGYATGSVDFGKGGVQGQFARSQSNNNQVAFLYPSGNVSNDRVDLNGNLIDIYVIFSLTYETT